MKTHYFNIFPLVFILFFSACKKKDSEPPGIVIIAPSDNTSWEIGGCIPFHVEITDNKNIEYARVTLLDVNSMPIGEQLVFSLSGEKCVIRDELSLTSSRLKNGKYKLLATAGDGYNEVRASVDVKLFGAIESDKLLVVFTENSDATMIHFVDSTATPNLWMTLNGDFLDAKCDEENRTLFIAPKTRGKLLAINVNGPMTNWEKPIQSSLSQNWFQSIEVINQSLYVGDYSGTTNVYDYWGYTTRVINSQVNYIPKSFLRYDQNTFVYSEPRSSAEKGKITAYNYGMALIRDSYAQYNVRKIYEKDANHLLLFSNFSGGTVISSFYWLYGNEDNLKIIADEQLNDVIALDADNYLLATDQAIHRYNAQQNSLVKIIDSGARNIAFEPERRFLICSQGQTLYYYYNYTTNALVRTVSFSNDIVKVLCM
ncbi:hypothetical protein LJC68_02555 [Bacteroidales bacterium OttesenSCG-928-B11]|nr:hypothetical protein [Bacteroidales bacterium OttesenSCG-928-B11]MDL2325449.1 hypothetical protein [Bacteroidales bacterium OttesenSCG-928-A14]